MDSSKERKRENCMLPSTRGNLLSIAILAIRLAASCITLRGPLNSSFNLEVCSD